MGEDTKALGKDIFSIWQIAAALSLEGKMSVTEQRDLAEALHVWAAYIRNGRNKTHTATELRRSRRAVRRIVRLIESDASPIPRTVRRVLLRDPVRPSFDEIVMDLTHGAGALEGTTADVPALAASIDGTATDPPTEDPVT